MRDKVSVESKKIHSGASCACAPSSVAQAQHQVRASELPCERESRSIAGRRPYPTEERRDNATTQQQVGAS